MASEAPAGPGSLRLFDEVDICQWYVRLIRLTIIYIVLFHCCGLNYNVLFAEPQLEVCQLSIYLN